MSMMKTLVVDEDTGEIVGEEKLVEPPYIKVYIARISQLMNLRGKHTSCLLWELVKRMSFDGVVRLVPEDREEIAAAVGCTKGHLNNFICDAVKSGVLARRGKGKLVVNPCIFARGSWLHIRKRQGAWIRMEIGADGEERLVGSFGEGA